MCAAMALTGIRTTLKLLRNFNISKTNRCLLNESAGKNYWRCWTGVCSLSARQLSTERGPRSRVQREKAEGAEQKPQPQQEKKKKPLKSPEITLISPEEELSSVTLEQAEKVAKRRNLKLVKIVDFDTKSKRPIYKLMTSLQFFEEETKAKQLNKAKKNSQTKEEKLFIFSSKINEHDILVKIKQMSKALTKNHKVRIYITIDGNLPKSDEITELIVEELKDVATLRTKAIKAQSTLKLFLDPKLSSKVTDEQKVKQETEDDVIVEEKENKDHKEKTLGESK